MSATQPCPRCGEPAGGRYPASDPEHKRVCWPCWQRAHGGNGDIPESEPSSNGHHPAGRYAGRAVDLNALLKQPRKPTPWRVKGLVADGTLTTIAAESGAGKSWLAHMLCNGVEQGETVAGFECAPGRALYIDAEMGPELVQIRLQDAGVAECHYQYRDAMGLDVSRDDDLAWLRSEIEVVEAKLVVIDSMRALTPSQKENDSDDMAPLLTGLRKLSRDTGAGHLLIHHKGDGDKPYRGSSAIKDQCDALFGMLVQGEGFEEVLKLSCRGKGRKPPRYAAAPADVWLRLSPADGGMVAAGPPSEPATGPSIIEALKSEIRKLAAKVDDPGWAPLKLAAAVGRPADDRSFKQAIGELVEAGEWAKTGATKSVKYRPSDSGDGRNDGRNQNPANTGDSGGFGDSGHSGHSLGEDANGRNQFDEVER